MICWWVVTAFDTLSFGRRLAILLGCIALLLVCSDMRHRELEAGAGTFLGWMTRLFAHAALASVFSFSFAILDAVAEFLTSWALTVGARLPRMALRSATPALPDNCPYVSRMLRRAPPDTGASSIESEGQ